jgi:hypothetical protein
MDKPEEPKCKICGDTGRAKPTLSEPDGVECSCHNKPEWMPKNPCKTCKIFEEFGVLDDYLRRQ